MFQAINKKNIKNTLNKNPIICFGSMPGACGPSGLCVVFFDDGSAYGYNTCYSKDQELIKLILEFIPELGACGVGSICEDENIPRRRRSQLNKMDSVYLGLGNKAYFKMPLYTQFTNLYEEQHKHRFVAFREYINTLGFIDLFDMWQIVEDELNKGKNEQ